MLSSVWECDSLSPTAWAARLLLESLRLRYATCDACPRHILATLSVSASCAAVDSDFALAQSNTRLEDNVANIFGAKTLAGLQSLAVEVVDADAKSDDAEASASQDAVEISAEMDESLPADGNPQTEDVSMSADSAASAAAVHVAGADSSTPATTVQAPAQALP